MDGMLEEQAPDLPVFVEGNFDAVGCQLHYCKTHVSNSRSQYMLYIIDVYTKHLGCVGLG